MAGEIPFDETITVNRRTFGFLVHHAFTHLWYAAQDEMGGCCLTCCGVCDALFSLHQDPAGDKLTEALRGYCQPNRGEGWWLDTDEVDWEAMVAAWRRFDEGDFCHHVKDGVPLGHGPNDAIRAFYEEQGSTSS